MELRGQDQNDVIRSSIPSSYALLERRNRELGGNNSNNGTNPPTTTPPAPTTQTTTILSYTTTPQTLDHLHHQHRLPGGSHTKRYNDKYRECLRNHAASVGGNVYDGCGEFMPGGEEGTLEALKCAACDCHRNFHRKETEGDTSSLALSQTQFSSRRRNVVATSTPNTATPTLVHTLQFPLHYHHHHHHQQQQQLNPQRYPPVVQPMSVAFGGGTESSSEELNVYQSNNNIIVEGGGGVPPPPPYVLSKKRFRTKFSQEQKEKMMGFAEKIGWRINRQDEGEVERFCEEVGVRRQVFKVWMHNNKNLKKGGEGGGGGGAPSQEEEEDEHHHHNHHPM